MDENNDEQQQPEEQPEEQEEHEEEQENDVSAPELEKDDEEEEEQEEAAAAAEGNDEEEAPEEAPEEDQEQEEQQEEQQEEEDADNKEEEGGDFNELFGIDDEEGEKPAEEPEQQQQKDSDDDDDDVLEKKRKKKSKKDKKSKKSKAEENDEAIKPTFFDDDEGWDAAAKASTSKPTTAAAAPKKRKLTAAEQLKLEEKQKDSIMQLLDRMDTAASNDRAANKAKQPALNKMRLLPEVFECMRKKNLQNLFKDCGAIKSIRKWLEPLPDGSLPNSRLCEQLLELLDSFDMEKNDIINSEIGAIIKRIRDRSDRATKVHRQANALMSKWWAIGMNLETSYRNATEITSMEKSRVTSNYDAYPISEGKRPGEAGFRWTAIQPREMPLVFSKNVPLKEIPNAKPEVDSFEYRIKKHSDNLKRSVSGHNKSLRAESLEIKRIQRVDGPSED